MGLRVDWQTTRENLTEQCEGKGKILPIFAIALETLAVKAFGNMGQTARLRLIRDRFIAGHENCDLRRYLDCVPPDTPLRDIVDRCRVWESHGATETRRVSKPVPEPVYPTYMVGQSDYNDEPVCVVSVNKQNNQMDQTDELLKKLLETLTTAASSPIRMPEITPLEKLTQLLISETEKREPAPPTPVETTGCYRRISLGSSHRDWGLGFDNYDVTGQM